MRELIKALHLIVEDPDEILASRIAVFTVSSDCHVVLLSHFLTS
jgi:hypothetical protein